MIRPRFALKLARTKLYSKPIMTSSSVLVSSILFAALIALTFIFTGAEQGAQEFIKRSGGNRYLVKVSPNIPNEVNGIYDNLSLEEIHEIKDFQKKYYDDLRARYKTLGLVYDEKSEIPALSPASWMSKTIPEEQRVVVNFSSPVITALNNQKLLEYSKNAKNKFSDLRTVGEKYGANGYYLAGNSSRLPQIPALRLIKDGKEDFGDSELKSGDMSTHGYYINAVHNGNYVFYDQRLLERYLIQDNPVLKGIPVVVSAQEVASLLKDELNVSDEPEEYTEKVTWLKDLRSKAQGKTYQVCYRNTTEQTLLEKIQSDYAEIKSNEKKLNYTEPSLQYDYPKQACGDIEIKKDSRTPQERKLATAAEESRKKLGEYVEPRHKMLTFQIVGIRYSQPMGELKNIGDHIKNNLLYRDDSISVEIPQQMYDSLPEDLKFDDIIKENNNPSEEILSSEDFAPRVLEFSSLDVARKFLENETCTRLGDKCSKKFYGSAFGSNYLILNEASDLFLQTSVVVLLVILMLATSIIWFTVSRIMSDRRKETAVYRAMGAKRTDIFAIYGSYVSMLALIISCLSLLFGASAAAFVDRLYSNELANAATAALGGAEESLHFSLFKVDVPILLVILALIFIVCFVASLHPLIHNSRRMPINDLREE